MAPIVPAGHYPDFARTPETIAGVRVYNGVNHAAEIRGQGLSQRILSRYGVADYSNQPAEPAVYLPDMYSDPTNTFNRAFLPHGFMMFLNMATVDLNSDGRADIPLHNIYPIDMAPVLAQTTKMSTTPESQLLNGMRRFMDRWFGISGLPGGIINQSFSYSTFSFNLDSTEIGYHIPDRLKPVSTRKNYGEMALTPNESGAIQTWLFTRASWAKEKLPLEHSMVDDAFISMASQLELFDRLAVHQFLIESAGNSETVWGGVAKGEDLFTPGWLVSAVISVGGLEADNGFSRHAVRAADVGAPFNVVFELTYTEDGKVTWKNTASGLTVTTDLELVPFEKVFTIVPKEDRDGTNQKVSTYTRSGGCHNMFANGRWIREGAEIEYEDPCTPPPLSPTEQTNVTATVIPGPKNVEIAAANTAHNEPAIIGDVYYLDANNDGIPDRPEKIEVGGTSPAAQYAAALAYLLLSSVEQAKWPKPTEFNRRLIKALHKLTGGKIFPGGITSQFIEDLKKEVFPK